MPRIIRVPDLSALPDLPTHQLTHAAKEFSYILEAIESELSSRATQTRLPLNYCQVNDDRGYESPNPDDDQYDDEDPPLNYAQPESDTYNPPQWNPYNPPQYQSDDEDHNPIPLNYAQPESGTYDPPTDYNYDEQYNSPTPPRQHDDDYYAQPESDTYNPPTDYNYDYDDCRSDDNPHYDY